MCWPIHQAQRRRQPVMSGRPVEHRQRVRYKRGRAHGMIAPAMNITHEHRRSW